MHDQEAASPRWKLNPKNFGPNIKSIKFLGLGEVKTRVGRVSGNNNIFRPYLVSVTAHMENLEIPGYLTAVGEKYGNFPKVGENVTKFHGAGM